MIFNINNTEILNYDIYTYSKLHNIDHKIIRFFLHEYGLKCKTKSNTSRKKSFITPNEEMLFTPLSIIAHQLYLCEGWHTDKTNNLYLCNQDIQLIQIFCECLLKIYNYQTVLPILLVYNFEDLKSNKTVNNILKKFINSDIYKIYHINDSSRKNPIIRVQAGGKNLSYLFIENAYKILHST